MNVTADIDRDRGVDEEKLDIIPILEENEETQKERESEQSLHVEKPLKEEGEAMQLNEKSAEGKQEATFSNEKLGNEREAIIADGKEIEMSKKDKYDKLWPISELFHLNETVGLSLDSSKIPSGENDETTAPKSSSIFDNRHPKNSGTQEMIEPRMSNDTNIVQSKNENVVIDQVAEVIDQVAEVIDKVAEVRICNNEIQMDNPSPQKQKLGGPSSLSIIAIEYGDINSDVEEIEADTTTENQYTVSQLQAQHLQQYRTVEENVSSHKENDSEDDSSSSSSSSSSSNSSSSDSSSDSDSHNIANVNKKKESKANTAKEGKHIQTELDNLPPIKDLQISVPEVLCNPLGKIENIVEQLVIVKPKPTEPILNLDTVLFVNKGTKVLGKIFDVFGPVNEPCYSIRFNNAKHIQDNDIKVGMEVYYCPSNPSFTSIVFLHELTKIKGCDTVGDDEPPAFSDDEEEQTYYKMMKQKNKNCSDGKTSQKKHRQAEFCNTKMGWQSNHPWTKNRNVQSQRYNWKKQQNWSASSHFNSAQDGPCPAYHNAYYKTYYNKYWQQYPYQNTASSRPVPQNMYPMSNRSYAGYRSPYSGQHLPQHNNSKNSDDNYQYYQDVEPNFQSDNTQNQDSSGPSGASPGFNPACS